MNIYSKKFISIIRILSLLAACFFAVSTGFEFHKALTHQITDKTIISIIGAYANLFNIALCIILFIFPAKIELVGIICLFYCFWINFVEPTSMMPEFLYFLSCSIFLMRRFYITNTKLKIFFSAIPYLFIMFFPLVLTPYNIWEILFQKAAFTFGLTVLYFVLSAYNSRLEDTSNDEAAPQLILNIANYKNLTERDCQWLNAILNNEKYESIAITHKMSLGSVKNRLKVIFQTLQVGDRIGFLNKYSHHKIVFTTEN